MHAYIYIALSPYMAALIYVLHMIHLHAAACMRIYRKQQINTHAYVYIIIN